MQTENSNHELNSRSKKNKRRKHENSKKNNFFLH